MLAHRPIILTIAGWCAGLLSFYVWHTLPQMYNERPQSTYISRVPRHMAIIMDGNRRWARERNLPAWEGHRNGVAPLRDMIGLCIEHGIPHLSVFAFSSENFKRPQEEKQFLFTTIRHHLVSQELPRLKEQGVRVNIVGDRELFPHDMHDDIDYVHQETAHNTQLQLHIMFCYGGRHEIARAARDISHAYARDAISEAQITPETVSAYLMTSDIPDPDLIIRTGGRRRISNFLIYQLAYSEIYFIDRYWPDITRADIYPVLQAFSQTERTFGG